MNARDLLNLLDCEDYIDLTVIDFIKILKTREYVRKYRLTHKGVSSTIYTQQIRSSKKRGHKLPSYTLKELREWMMSRENYTKLWMEWVDSDYSKLKKPSVDRIDDYDYYHFDNIQLVTWEDNLRKAGKDRADGINNKQNRLVYQYTQDGVLVDTYYSMHYASLMTGVNLSCICEVCNGNKTQAGGFLWKADDRGGENEYDMDEKGKYYETT